MATLQQIPDEVTHALVRILESRNGSWTAPGVRPAW
jgi:hypothetical protein